MHVEWMKFLCGGMLIHGIDGCFPIFCQTIMGSIPWTHATLQKCQQIIDGTDKSPFCYDTILYVCKKISYCCNNGGCFVVLLVFIIANVFIVVIIVIVIIVVDLLLRLHAGQMRSIGCCGMWYHLVDLLRYMVPGTWYLVKYYGTRYLVTFFAIKVVLAITVLAIEVICNLFYLYYHDSVLICRTVVRSRMFYPAKVEMIHDIVCSCTKEYQSYNVSDSIISKFAGRTSCYAASGVSPSPAKVA